MFKQNLPTRRKVRPISVELDIPFSSAIENQRTLSPKSETRNGLILIRTAIPDLSRQFFIFLHPAEIDKYAMRELMSTGINHPALTSRIVKELSSGGLCSPETDGKRLVYDIGGNIGYMSLLFASLGADVVGVEPTAFHGSLFRASATLNPHLSENIEIVRTALTDRVTNQSEVCMELPDPDNAGFTRVGDGKDCPEAMRAPLATLDELLTEYGSQPCAMKVDVEGFELKALVGGVNTLKKNPPNFVVVEYNGYTSMERSHDLAEHTVDFFFKELSVKYMEDLNFPGKIFKTREECVDYLSPTRPPYAGEMEKWNTDLIFYRK